MTLTNCVYAGSVMHRRITPKQNRFRYRVWWLMVELDELPNLSARTNLFSHNRFNLFSLYDRDFGSGEGDLRRDLEKRLAQAGLTGETGRIYLLTMPRLLGYAFNPLSIYFCLRKSGEVFALIYEVHNTFAERHSYVLPARVDSDGLVRQTTDKSFYVSPFLEMDLRYTFRVRAPFVEGPGEDLAVSITATRGAAPVIYASLHGRRKTMSDGQLLLAFATYPFVTLKVVAAIHWQAVRLWLMRLPLVPRDPKRDGSTITQQGKLHA